MPREHDVHLAEVVSDAAAGTSGIAVLVGGSSTGKTRACWEALRPLRERTEPWQLWHPIDPTRPDAARADLARVGPYTVIWLNEAQFYLDPSTGDLGERLAAGLRSVLRDADRGPVLILATLWPTYWTTLTTQPDRTEPDVHAQARELLEGQPITVPEAFTDADLDGLDARSSQDLRLAEAADGAQDGQITQYLAGVPVLMDRYRNAEPATKALIQAAMDARRLGCGPHLPRALLAAAVPSYLTETEWHRTADDWLGTALDYAARPCNGIPGILTPVKPGPARDHRPMGSRLHQRTEPPSGPNHRLADYLDQHGRQHRREHIPPIGFWTALAVYAHPRDLSALAEAAWDRGLFRDAAQLWKNAVTSGDLTGAAKLIDLMRFRHPADHRPARWAAAQIPLDDSGGVARLVKSLSEVGAGEQVAVLLARDPATHAALDDAYGVGRLLASLHRVGTEDESTALARRAAAHVALDDHGGLHALLDTLREVGATEQATELARRAAARVPIHHDPRLSMLLDRLIEVGPQDAKWSIIQRMPAAGLFAKFMVFDENRERFKFGREPDGAAAPLWGWDDLA